MTAIDFTGFFERLARDSGEVILPFFRSHLGVEDKSAPGAPRGFDPVTEADRAAETVLRRLIGATFPDHGIIGEEFGTINPGADYVWVLDPIDGTRSFISGVPMWGTLIGLMHHGVPAYGVMNQPYTSERFRGDGHSASLTHADNPPRPLHSRRCATLAEATLMTTSPYLFGDEERPLYKGVEAEARLVRYGCDCYAYCMLASGHVDLVIESGLQPYDIVALIPIVEGAGGKVTNWQGGPAASGGNIVASGDASLHEQVLKRLNR
ncbi:MAG: histidinol-phosphatase [Hyphomicrobiales bacterium]|nr:histidinol-phosphatase [Hyphomicrobiales bacterium]